MNRLPLLVLGFLIPSSLSLKCYQKFNDGSNGTCAGDVCVVRYRGSTVLAQGCTISGYYDSLRGYCVRQADVDECYCSANDMCNVIAVSNSSKIATLQKIQCFAGTSSQCYGSTCSMKFGTTEKMYCENTTESVIWRANSDSYIGGDVSLSDPSSSDTLAVVVNGTAKSAKGSCYTENCWTAAYTAKVKFMMTKNVSTWCYVGENPKACLGDYCYITRVKTGNATESFTRGCMIIDGLLVSKSIMLSGAGIDHFIDTTTIHCMDENCNESLEKAWTSIGKPYGEYLFSSSMSSFEPFLLSIPIVTISTLLL